MASTTVTPHGVKTTPGGYIDDVLNQVKAKNPAEPEFHQAVQITPLPMRDPTACEAAKDQIQSQSDSKMSFAPDARYLSAKRTATERRFVRRITYIRGAKRDVRAAHSMTARYASPRANNAVFAGLSRSNAAE